MSLCVHATNIENEKFYTLIINHHKSGIRLIKSGIQLIIGINGYRMQLIIGINGYRMHQFTLVRRFYINYG